MGKYSGRVLTVYITRDGVRVCEGENKNGNPDVSKFFLVGGVSEYFSEASTNAPPDIVNMSGLVSAIVSECKNRHTTARRVMVCSDCFGIETEVQFDESVGGLKNLLTGDLKSIKLSKGSSSAVLPDKLQCKQVWGELTQDGAVHKVSTKSIGDKYMLKSLVQEFYGHGYEVVFVSGAQEVLFNFRQTELASFDSQGKIIFDYDVFCGVTVFVKDIPVQVSRLAMIDRDSITQRLHSQLNDATLRAGRNPKIYLTGSVFSDTALYAQVMDELESDGYVVYDLFNRPEVGPDYQRLLDAGAITPIMTPDYSANIAMLMCPFAKTLISMTPAVDTSDILKKNAKTLVTLVLGASVAAVAVTAGIAGVRAYNLYQMDQNPSNLANLQNQVISLTTRQQNLNSTIQTLTQADTTILELMKFIEVNQSDRVCVVSMDTRDMLTDEVSVDTSGVTVTQPATTAGTTTATGGTAVDTSGVTTGDATVSGSAGGSGGSSVRENIVIRGYAKSGNEAVSYYNRLFKYGLPSDPILNGVERYTLPGGEEVYVFEIEIGGDMS